MFTLQKRQTSMLVWNSVLILLSVGMLLACIRLIVAYRYTHARLVQVNERSVDIQKQNSDLDDQIRNLTTADGIEYFVRDQYRAVAAGEQLVVLVDDTVQQPVSVTPSTVHISWWKRMFNRQ